LEISSEGLD
jgi:hypothetical protein